MAIILCVFAIVALLTPLATKTFGPRIFYGLAVVPAAAFVYLLTMTPTVVAGGTVVESYEWIPQLSVELTFTVETLSWIMGLIVTGVGALVLLYCARYFGPRESDLGRFASILFLFAGVMFGLVTTDDMIVMFVFWEATSVLSYLLIGHYFTRKESRGAALQALLVTTVGGLAMLVGLIILASLAGSNSITAVVAAAPTGDLANVAVVLVLLGALSKSALVPFHFWLPAAMAAPTPVSAYLHAAAMVKAGIFLVARFAPGFADNPVWLPIVVTVGVATMLLGAWRSLRQFDLKLILAYGTVSQLGFLTVAVGFGTTEAALAGIALVLAHALYKAALFLIVGIVDKRAGTRDWRKLSGVGRTAPALTVIAIVAAASMAGLPPTLGFVAKEAVLTAFLEAGGLWGWVALVGAIIGSILTVAYAARFIWGAFARRPDREDIVLKPSRWDFDISPAVLAGLGIVLGIASGWLSGFLEPYADTVGHEEAPHLALWHGFTPALWITIGILAVGAVMFWQRKRIARAQAALPHSLEAADVYWAIIRATDRGASKLTGLTQRGSLPGYLASIFVVLVAAGVWAIANNSTWVEEPVFFYYPAQIAVAIVMIVAGILVAKAKRRLLSVLLVGVVGYGVAALFVMSGAPDLALTQVLIETVTLVVFVLVSRRLQPSTGLRHAPKLKRSRALLSILVGVTIAILAYIALGARTATPISVDLPQLAAEVGKGANVVNVLLVDIRGWDTLGEVSVLVVAATGVASLIFISRRTGAAPRLVVSNRRGKLGNRGRAPVEPTRSAALSSNGQVSVQRSWLLAGKTQLERDRSVLLEIVVRLLFHPAIILSIFLIFTGHNNPGGGFAGGLVAGLALVGRYLAGGRYELGEALPVEPGKLLGAGLMFVVGTALSSFVFGLQALESYWFDFELPLIGELHLGSSTFFDIGVYLVVVGLVLDILRSLGGELDRQVEESEVTVDNNQAPTAALSLPTTLQGPRRAKSPRSAATPRSSATPASPQRPSDGSAT